MIIEELINKNYSRLNENDLYIWNYISKHRRECEKLSIDALAKKCHVSRSTVLRFAKRLGLKGYSELKVLLKMDNEAVESNKLNDDVYESYMKCLKHIQESQYLDIVKAIYDASQVFVYGTGDIQDIVIHHAQRLFIKVGKYSLDMDRCTDFEAYYDLCDQKSVFIAVTYSGENADLIDYVDRVKSRGATVIIISARSESTLSRMADHSLYIDEIEMKTHLGDYEYLLGSYFVLIDFLFANYVNYAKSRGED